MPESRRILVPVDFSTRANEALDYAVQLAKPLKAKIVILHAIEPMIYADRWGNRRQEDHRDWRAKIDGELAKLAASVKKKMRSQPATLVRQGRAFQEIARAAKEVDADLVVMGSEGYSGGTYSLLGSTAERVARKAQCPVLLVRKKGRELG